MFDVTIVGCGIAGCYLANLLSKEGFKVLAIEEHKKIGYPSKCTGLVSWRIKKLISKEILEKVIQNEIKKAKFISPSKLSFELISKKGMYVLDRPKLDFLLYKNSLNSNVIFKLGEKFLDFKIEKNQIKIKTNKKIYSSKILIGSDGSYSLIAKKINAIKFSKTFFGVQSLAKSKFEKDKVELWFGSKFSKEFFAWVVPINENYAKIGIASKENPLLYYKNFLKERIGNFLKPDTAGIIRIGLTKTSVYERILLVGDSSLQIKPFSGGGITYSLISSQIAFQAIKKSLEKQIFSKQFFEKEYDKKWREKIESGIKKGLFLRKIFYHSDKWIDFLFILIKLFGKKSLQKFDEDLL